MGVVSTGIEVAKHFVPPPSDDLRVTVWRWFMVAGVMSSLFLSIAVIFGVIKPATSLAAEEQAGKLEELSKQTGALRRERLEQQIFELRIDQCMAEGKLKTIYSNRLAEYVSQWRALTGNPGNPPTLVDCDDLGQ